MKQPEKISTLIGSKLRELREAAGLSRNDVAFYTRIKPSVIRALEIDERAPTVDEVKAIRKFFGVDNAALGLKKYLTKAAPAKPVETTTEDSKDEEKEDKEYYIKTMPDMPDMLDVNACRSLISAILYSALKDARDVSHYEDAAAFVRRSRCHDLCYDIGLNYEKYKARVLSLCSTTDILGAVVENAKTAGLTGRARLWVDTYVAEWICEAIGKKYVDFKRAVLRLCKETEKREAEKKKREAEKKKKKANAVKKKGEA